MQLQMLETKLLVNIAIGQEICSNSVVYGKWMCTSYTQCYLTSLGGVSHA